MIDEPAPCRRAARHGAAPARHGARHGHVGGPRGTDGLRQHGRVHGEARDALDRRQCVAPGRQLGAVAGGRAVSGAALLAVLVLVLVLVVVLVRGRRAVLSARRSRAVLSAPADAPAASVACAREEVWAISGH